MGALYYSHLKRMQCIKQTMPGVQIIEMWECDWDKISPKSSKVHEPLNPRDALFGGRTNAFKLHHKCGPHEQIKYQDYTSLYPDIQKYGVFPIGHPQIFTENFGDVSNYFGLIKCRILPPQNLYIPVLPARFNSKLIFTLCNQCALDQQAHCNHSQDQRILTWTWVTLEVQEAIKHGYQVIEIIEVWHYSSSAQYDRYSKSGGIFTDYVNTFLKFKTESSALPEGYSDEEEFRAAFFENEGIMLGPVQKNSGLRSVAKLMLNSFWGRFGMKTNRVSYKIISEPAEWFDMLNDDQYVIHNVDFVRENLIQVFYSKHSEMQDDNSEINVPLAAFVTCQARLKLFRELVKLDDRVLYFDTDSIIFISRPFEYEPALGGFLGEFTNEIDSEEGEYIEEFVSAGPKNYAYKLNTGITHCIVKGFSLNSSASEQINFESIREIVLNNQSQKIEVEQLKFTRNKHDWSVSSYDQKKMYGFVYDKRILFENLSTLPYGYLE